MTELAPRRPFLDPLVAEARRRARRRRIRVGAGLVAAIAAGGAVFGALSLTGGGRPAGVAPPGMKLVRAQGPVKHALTEVRWRAGPRSISLASGDVRPAKVTREVWWDQVSGLERVVERIDGRVRYDVVGQACGFTRGGRRTRSCAVPSPFDLKEAPRRWADRSARRIRVERKSVFRGRTILWISGPSYEPVAIDAETREPRLIRELSRKHELIFQTVITIHRDLPADRVTFAIPKDGLPTWPYFNFPPRRRISIRTDGSGIRGASAAIGRVPLWLGREFRGHRLRGVEFGTTRVQGRTGTTFRSVRWARFDYGFLALKEFGRGRPPNYEQGPRRGSVVLEGAGPGVAVLTHDGTLVVISRHDRNYRITPRRSIALARALRPVAAR